MPQNQVNNAIYDQYGDRWYTAYDDPVALLRAEAKLKNPWIQQKIEDRFAEPVDILDIGCGGGFLSNFLSEKGHRVTGVDLSGESLAVARRHDRTQTARYIEADAYQLPFADSSFDVITAMDFLEHVEDPAKVIQEAARVLRPGGLFFFHTFNRNWISYIVVIKMVEWLVRNAPEDMHVLRLFVKPSEARKYCQSSGLEVQEMKGIKPVFSSIPVKNVFTGVVPTAMRFEFTKSLLLSYIGYATKPYLS